VYIAGPGSLLGLPALITNTRFSVSAEVLDSAVVLYIARNQMMKILKQSPSYVRKCCVSWPETFVK
jgi:CRP-like cAMP-binding protein